MTVHDAGRQAGGQAAKAVFGSGRQRCNIHKIARLCGVRVHDGARRYSRRNAARKCYAPATLRRIGQALGEAHLALVLRLIAETEGNETEFHAETLMAVSALLEHEPALIDRGSALFEAFDRIDLADLRRRSRTVRCGLPPGHVLRVLLRLEIDGDGSAGRRNGSGE